MLILMMSRATPKRQWAEGGILRASVVACLVATVTKVRSGEINFIIQNIITSMYN